MKPAEYHAAKLNELTSQFTELRLPVQPRLVTDLFPVRLESGALHLVGAEAKTLGGESLRWMLRTLFPLLDGTRTISEIAAAVVPVQAADLRDVLSLLHMHGMLEEGRESNIPEDERNRLVLRHGPQMQFFSRYLRLTGRHDSRFGPQRALGSARVATVAAPEHRAVIAPLLEAMGLGGCFGLDLESISAFDGAAVDLTVIVSERATQERMAGLLRGCPILFVDPHAWTLGPLTVFGHSACPTCVRLQRSAPAQPEPLSGQLSALEQGAWSRALLSRAAQHVVAYITGLYQCLAFEHIEYWDPSTGATGLLAHVHQLPNCPSCGAHLPPLNLTFASGHRDNRALFFHRSALLKPWHLEQPAAIQIHLSAGVSEQLRNARLSPRRVASGQHAGETSVAVSQVERSRFAQRLGQLLTWSFGGRTWPMAEGGERFCRYTASAGNLGSAECYVIVGTIDDLAPGVYHYDSTHDRLDALHDDRRDEGSGLLGSPANPAAEPCALIVIVSAVARLCTKYQARGYVYSLLDAGIMAHRIDLLARSLGMRATPHVDFDDNACCRRLGVDGLDLAPVLVVALHDAA